MRQAQACRAPLASSRPRQGECWPPRAPARCSQQAVARWHGAGTPCLTHPLCRRPGLQEAGGAGEFGGLHDAAHAADCELAPAGRSCHVAGDNRLLPPRLRRCLCGNPPGSSLHRRFGHRCGEQLLPLGAWVHGCMVQSTRWLQVHAAAGAAACGAAMAAADTRLPGTLMPLARLLQATSASAQHLSYTGRWACCCHCLWPRSPGQHGCVHGRCAATCAGGCCFDSSARASRGEQPTALSTAFVSLSNCGLKPQLHLPHLFIWMPRQLLYSCGIQTFPDAQL